MSSNNQRLLTALTPMLFLFACSQFEADRASNCLKGSPAEFFNNVLNVEEEASKAAQGLHFEVLSAAEEPALLCTASQRAVRVSQRSTVGGRRLITRASESDSVYQLRTISNVDAPASQPRVLADRHLTAAEWSRLWETMSGPSMTELRVIPVPAPRRLGSLDGESTLFEIRVNDNYYVAVRRTENMEPQLRQLLAALTDLSQLQPITR